MATYDNTYSRVVAGLKIALPLLALAILSTLFLVARTIDPAQTIPYAEVDIDELMREQRVGRPNYATVTRDGAAITLAASRARPVAGDPNRLIGDEIVAAIDLTDGTRIDIRASELTVDNPARLAGLRGGVVLESSDGYAVTTEAIDVALDRTRVASESEVRATGPGTALTAGRFELSRVAGAGDEAGYVLVFTGGVKLLYTPEG